MWKSTNVDPTEAGSAGVDYKGKAWRKRRVGPRALSCPPAGAGHSEALLCCRATSDDNYVVHV